MLISNIINDGFGLLSKQLRFYCWHFRRDLDQRQRQELIQLLYEQHFERLATKIRTLNSSAIADSRQQIGKLLFDHCLSRNRRHQLVQLIESNLVDINVRLDNYGRTLLHRAAYNLDVELVKLLIEHRVNFRLRDYAGNTALHIAIQSYRNGALLYGNGLDVKENLTSIIRVLLSADKHDLGRYERIAANNKRLKLTRPRNAPADQPNLCRRFSRNLRNDASQTSLVTSPGPDRRHSSVGGEFPEDSGNREQSASKTVGKSELDAKQPATGEQSSAGYQLERLDGQLVSSGRSINPILLEDASSPLVNTKNAFGRTALHYCVIAVGEQHLSHFVRLLISYGADPDAVDARMKTPLYCLVKQPISAIRQKCSAISQLIEAGCDDLGLAIEDPHAHFSDEFIESTQSNISTILQFQIENSQESIFSQTTFRRVPSLKHLSRLSLIRISDKKLQLKRQTKLTLPKWSPNSLHYYVNRKILDQSELF